MQLARWPNEGWVTIKRVVDRGTTGGDEQPARGGTFVYGEERPGHWDVDRGVWLHGYWCHDWSDECLRVARIETTKREITLAAPHGYGIGPSSSWNREPRRYYALNTLEELDAPGEWYLDRDQTLLYVWPSAGLTDAEVLISTLSEPLIVLEECEHMRLRDLKLEASCGEGIVVRGGRGNLVASWKLTNLGDSTFIRPSRRLVPRAWSSQRVNFMTCKSVWKARLRKSVYPYRTSAFPSFLVAPCSLFVPGLD